MWGPPFLCLALVWVALGAVLFSAVPPPNYGPLAQAFVEALICLM